MKFAARLFDVSSGSDPTPIAGFLKGFLELDLKNLSQLKKMKMNKNNQSYP